MFKRIAVCLTATVIGLMALTGVSWAQTPNPNPSSSASTGVNGTFTIPAALTVTLNQTSFNNSGNSGTTYLVPTANASTIQATVSTNDGNGYQLLNAIGNGFNAGADNIPNSNITPLVYPGGPNTTPAILPTTNNFGNNAIEVVGFSNTFTANPGDVYNQQWQFALPQSQPAGQYTGTIQVLALGN